MIDSCDRRIVEVGHMFSITCILIVALSALISVLADSYARVQENAVANRRKERAEVS